MGIKLVLNFWPGFFDLFFREFFAVKAIVNELGQTPEFVFFGVLFFKGFNVSGPVDHGSILSLVGQKSARPRASRRRLPFLFLFECSPGWKTLELFILKVLFVYKLLILSLYHGV